MSFRLACPMGMFVQGNLIESFFYTTGTFEAMSCIEESLLSLHVTKIST